jgi:hypothetical protein
MDIPRMLESTSNIGFREKLSYPLLMRNSIMNSQRPQAVFDAIAYAGVMQDKQPQVRLAVDSPHPLTASQSAVGSKKGRATATAPAVDRLTHHGSEKRQTDQVTGRVPHHVKTALLQVAKANGWTESKAVATACEAYLEHDLGEKFGVRLAA